MRTRLLAILLAASAAAFGADRDFDRLVSAVQIRFGTPPEHIPLMGFANFLVSVTKLAGTSGFRLAVFDNLRFDSDGDGAALDRIMASVSKGLDPLVRVRSNADHEWTYIYAVQDGKRAKMLIATFERDEAIVAELNLTMDALVRRLSNPATAGRISTR